MNIEKYPQYELYKFTKKLYEIKDKLVPPNCDIRCVLSTIINRCYYSSYLYSSEWLYEKYEFKPSNKENQVDKTFITEHTQVRRKLKDVGKVTVSNNLFKLATLRKKADYEPFQEISKDELEDAVYLMNSIFQNLTF